MNLSSNAGKYTKEGTYTLGVIYFVASLLVMSANGVVVFVVAKTKELHMPTLWIVTWMAIFDFLMGLYAFIFVVPSAFLNRYAYSERTIGFASCLIIFIIGQVVFNVALAVIDRCIAVCWPLQYIHIITTKRFIITVLITMFLSAIRLVLITVPDGDFYYNGYLAYCIVEFDTAPTVVAATGFPIVTLSLIVICFLMIFTRRLSLKTPVGVYIRPESRVKFPMMCLVSTSVFCISYIPFTMGIILSYVSGKESVPTILVRIVMVGLLSNSLWNVFIYTATYEPFRDALFHLFCRNYHRKVKQREIYSLHSAH